MDNLIEQKINSVLTERKIKDMVQERVARLITQENLKDLIGPYTMDDYNNRMSQVFSNIMLKSPTFKELLRDNIKKSIKIG